MNSASSRRYDVRFPSARRQTKIPPRILSTSTASRAAESSSGRLPLLCTMTRPNSLKMRHPFDGMRAVGVQQGIARGGDVLSANAHRPARGGCFLFGDLAVNAIRVELSTLGHIAIPRTAGGRFPMTMIRYSRLDQVFLRPIYTRLFHALRCPDNEVSHRVQCGGNTNEILLHQCNAV